MNTKIQKLKAERAKQVEKDKKIQERIAVIDKEIEQLENVEIVGIVRAYKIDLAELPELLKRIKERSAASEEK